MIYTSRRGLVRPSIWLANTAYTHDIYDIYMNYTAAMGFYTARRAAIAISDYHFNDFPDIRISRSMISVPLRFIGRSSSHLSARCRDIFGSECHAFGRHVHICGITDFATSGRILNNKDCNSAKYHKVDLSILELLQCLSHIRRYDLRLMSIIYRESFDDTFEIIIFSFYLCLLPSSLILRYARALFAQRDTA